MIKVEISENEKFPVHMIFDDGTGRMMTVDAAVELCRDIAVLISKMNKKNDK